MAELEHPADPQRVEAVRAQDVSAPEAEHLAGLLTLLADPLRVRLLTAMLAAEEVCVGDLAFALDASEDAVSYGLRLLRTAGLVRRRRAGRMGYYGIPRGKARDALATSLAQLRQLGELHPESRADDIEDG